MKYDFGREMGSNSIDFRSGFPSIIKRPFEGCDLNGFGGFVSACTY